MKNPPITITAIAHGEEIIISLLSEAFAWFGVTNEELVLAVFDVESKEENKFADILRICNVEAIKVTQWWDMRDNESCVWRRDGWQTFISRRRSLILCDSMNGIILSSLYIFYTWYTYWEGK